MGKHERPDRAEELADLKTRVAHAQRLAGMGDYEWDAASGHSHWSDHLFRLYGFEPGAFVPTYARFLALVHPDDRAMVEEAHRASLASGEPFELVERIVRPDGSVRHLLSSGEVLHSADGDPHIRGICMDVTDRVAADQERSDAAHRFADLVESSPDAILVIEPTGRVVQANSHAARLLGGDPQGADMSALLALVPADSAALGIELPGLDGRDLLLDVSTARLGGAGTDDDVAAFLHDAATRLEREHLAAQLRETQVRRRQALELNDNVVQALTTAGHALQRGDTDQARALLEHTLSSARRLMGEWIHSVDSESPGAGDLVRVRASTTMPGRMGRPRRREPVDHPVEVAKPAGATGRAGAPTDTPRVLVVDDNVDLRELFALQLQMSGGFDIVGQAGDGAEAVLQASELLPDVVLLDLAMPLMDGLQALPLILEAVPTTKVIVVSGFDERSLADQALGLGAVRYLEKGLDMGLPEAVREVLADAERTPAAG